MFIQIQTNGEITPSNALRETIKSLIDDFDLASKKFGEELRKIKG
jgi:DNA-directed RNA polymerase subunit L